LEAAAFSSQPALAFCFFAHFSPFTLLTPTPDQFSYYFDFVAGSTPGLLSLARRIYGFFFA